MRVLHLVYHWEKATQTETTTATLSSRISVQLKSNNPHQATFEAAKVHVTSPHPSFWKLFSTVNWTCPKLNLLSSFQSLLPFQSLKVEMWSQVHHRFNVKYAIYQQSNFGNLSNNNIILLICKKKVIIFILQGCQEKYIEGKNAVKALRIALGPNKNQK